MGNAFAFAESRGGELRPTAFETVTAARRAADATGGGEVHALVVGGPGVAAKAESLAKYGADLVTVVEHADLGRYSAEVVTATAAARLRGGAYRAAFFPASAQGRDLAPRVAAAIDKSLASDVTAFEVEGEGFVVRHPVYASKAAVTLRLTGAPALISLRPGAITPVEARGQGRVETGTPAIDPASAKVVVTEMLDRGSAKLDLGDAPVIVSGGRGLRAKENFAMIEELAAAFGNAAVGATRAVTDDGWRPSTDQIGQTGRVVNPMLYIAVGISGAVQHLAGMRSARTIVAINKDKDAPIFKIADYGIVGDLFEIVPRLIAEVKKAKGK